jgi:uncharacterized delta-60 repeat protein
MKKFVFTAYFLSLLLLILIIAGSAQTRDKEFFSIHRTMKEVIWNIAKEMRDVSVGSGSVSELVEAMANNPNIYRKAARASRIVVSGKGYDLAGGLPSDFPSGEELHSIYRAMIDTGMIDKYEQKNVFNTMKYVRISKWDFRLLPERIRKKIDAIYQIATSSDPNKLISSLVSNGDITNRSHKLYGSGPLDRSIPLQKEKSLKKKSEARPGPIQSLKSELARSTWARTYGDASYDYAMSIQQTSDGGQIVAGYSLLFLAPGYQDAFVLKLSSGGEIQWQRAYDGADTVSSIKQTIDGGYVVAGYTSANDITEYDFWISKLDSSGNMEWQQAYGGSDGDWANSIWQTTDGGYIVAGMTQSFSAGDYDLWILKLSSSGDIEWQRAYGGNGHDVAESIQQTSDGGYIVAGGTSSIGAGLYDYLVLKLSAAGDIEWQKTYGKTWSESAHSIQQTADGGYILAGDEPGRDNVIVKLSSTGNIEWQRTYWGDSEHRVRSIKQTNDGGYIVAGTTSYAGRAYDTWLIKLTAAGDIVWQCVYGGEKDEIGMDIDQDQDGRYIVAGYTWSFGAGNSDILILKVSPTGEIEKFPEITRVSNAIVSEASLVAQDIDFVPQETTITAFIMSVTSYSTNKQKRLVFSPPSNFMGKRILNRSLSQAEYIDLLTWTANPNNSDLNIVKYRVYQIEYYAIKSLLVELDPDDFEYLIRNVPKSAYREYAVSNVTDKDEESMAAFIELR